MADVTIRRFQLRRSLTPGYRPPSLGEGEALIQFADSKWILGGPGGELVDVPFSGGPGGPADPDPSFASITVTGNAAFAARPTVGANTIWDGGALVLVVPGMYGIKGDGSTDDRPAIQALIGSVSDGTTLLFLKGAYRLGAPLTITNKSVPLMALGRGAVRFLCDANGLAITTNSVLTRIHVEGFVWQRTAGSAGAVDGTAITVSRPAGLSSCTEPGPVVRGNTFVGQFSGAGASQPLYTTAWLYGAEITAGWNGFFEENFFRGKDGNYTGALCRCSDHTTPLNFHRNIAYFCERMLHFMPGSFAEGLNATGNEGVAVLDGFFLDDGTAAPHARIMQNHINAARFGIRCVNRPQIWVADNLIYNWNNQGSGQGVGGVPFVGIQFEGAAGGCPDAFVRHNVVIGFNGVAGVTGSTCGIAVQNSFATLLEGNEIITCTSGIDGIGSFKGRIFGNHFNNVVNRLVGVPAGSATANNTYSNDGSTIVVL